MEMMDRSVTGLLLDAIAKLEYIVLIGGTIADYDSAWHEAGSHLDIILQNEDNLQMFVDYLKAEFHAGHSIDPQIRKLRELLESAVKVRPDDSVPVELRHNFHMLRYKCSDWIYWINQYFPAEQSKQVPVEEVTIKPKRISAAAQRLATPELQAVKQKLVGAGLIVDGRWDGTPAEFGCLVQELLDQYQVANNGGKAWKDCAEWAGYAGNIQSARNAIDANPNTRGDIADTIRRICRKK